MFRDKAPAKIRLPMARRVAVRTMRITQSLAKLLKPPAHSADPCFFSPLPKHLFTLGGTWGHLGVIQGISDHLEAILDHLWTICDGRRRCRMCKPRLAKAPKAHKTCSNVQCKRVVPESESRILKHKTLCVECFNAQNERSLDNARVQVEHVQKP
jgi:hypothetical protein